MDSHEDATLAMNSKCLKSSHYSSSLGVISLKNWASRVKTSFTTATITIKPEHLAHHCVEQDFVRLAGLNLTEAKISGFLHHLHSKWLFAVSDRVCYDKNGVVANIIYIVEYCQQPPLLSSHILHTYFSTYLWYMNFISSLSVFYEYN